MAERAFLTLLLLLLISSILGAVVFYRYYFSVQGPVETLEEEDALTFKMASYNNILDKWKERNERISQVDRKEYANPFESGGVD